MSDLRESTLLASVPGRTGVRIPIRGFGTAPGGTWLNLKEVVRLYGNSRALW